jgi:hypothetical protein
MFDERESRKAGGFTESCVSVCGFHKWRWGARRAPCLPARVGAAKVQGLGAKPLWRVTACAREPKPGGPMALPRLEMAHKKGLPEFNYRYT